MSCRTHIEFQHIMHVPSILHIISHNVFDVLRSCKRVYDARVYMIEVRYRVYWISACLYVQVDLANISDLYLSRPMLDDSTT